MKNKRLCLLLAPVLLLFFAALWHSRDTDTAVPTEDSATDEHSVRSSRSSLFVVSDAVQAEESSSAGPVLRTSPELSHEELLKKAKELEKDKRTYRFAEAIQVDVNPSKNGVWKRDGDRQVWNLEIVSAGATSLNLGFKRYSMPEGGELVISQPGEESPYRAFTAADNEEHGELWTPIIRGESIALSLSVPEDKRHLLELQLASVNHGFRPWKMMGDGKVLGSSISQLCNIDAVCRSGDPFVNDTLGPILDLFRPQVRSVAAYTVDGQDTCSGALINNTANDKRGFFLTAEHCSVTSGNAASAVFYFNYQNSFCRTRGSVENTGTGDGGISQFSSGSFFRAANAASDFCLLELDDPIPDSYDVFFAGWDRTGSVPTSAIGIHHPAVAEKRFSLDVDSLVNLGNFWEVSDWDYGTTEGGSSGSPLFDASGRIVGQLYGGNAACGNNLEDEYGKISSSWTGGGSSSSRLSDWLDPGNTGVTTLDGLEPHSAITITDVSMDEGDSGSTNMEFTVQLYPASSGTVTVEYQTASSSATSGSDFTATSGTATFLAGETEYVVSVSVTGDTDPESDETFFINLSSASGAYLRDVQAVGEITNDDHQLPSIVGTDTANGEVDSLFSYTPTIQNATYPFKLTGGRPAGMLIDPGTGEVTWVPTAAGSFTFTITAGNPAGSASSTVTVNVAAADSSNPVFAVDMDGQGVSASQSATPWYRQTSVKRDGVDALQSGNISHGQATGTSLKVNGPGTVSFWTRTRTEEIYDVFYFSINGDARMARSGNNGWTKHTYDLDPGLNVLSWVYDKDGSVSSGADAVWVDEVTLTGYAGWAATHQMASNALFGADSDYDRVPNGVEYATGMMPGVSDPNLLPPVQRSSGLLQMSFTKPVGISGIYYNAEVSDDLVSWTTVGRDIITDNATTFTARQSAAEPVPTEKYMRLKVETTP